MQRQKIKYLSLCFGFTFLFMSPGEAQAYFDPGTGSILLQSLAAGFLAVAVFWRCIKEQLSGFFKKKTKGDGE